ncbi:MAG: response regulator [Planctomycetota bacterium]|nr:MAG: response regulator [Planctomycetota bacterium]
MSSAASRDVLVVEDEPDILEVLVYNLRREGYSVRTARDGEQAIARALEELPRLILLDLMLPRLGGLEVCRRLRTREALRDVPIIMVTAKGQEEDVVQGLEVGADDYVTKPFRVRELLARVKAVLRRRGDGERSRIERDELVIDLEGHEVRVGRSRVHLTATEFRILAALARRPGWVLTRGQLLDRAVGPTSEVGERNIDVHVGALRKKLGPYRELLETVRGVGYRFRA